MNSFRFSRSLVGAMAITLASVVAVPAAEPPDFAIFLEGVKQEARGKGIGEQTLGAALDGIQPVPRVVELDRKQPEFTLTFEQYLSRTVTPTRVEKGKRKLAEHRAVLEEVAAKYKVQPRFIVALWGMETDFGRVTGGFDVIPALATLAWDGRRSAFFRTELMHALRILDEDHIKPQDMKGSWAGAMGQPQFMPSSFVRFAQDHDGDGRQDIWGTEADVFASAANYLASVGWRDDLTWGREVRLPQGFDPSLADREKIRKPLTEWAELGVRRADGGPLPARGDIAAALVLIDDGKGPSFLVYDNFQTIMHWNRSTFYAVAVGRLADLLASR